MEKRLLKEGKIYQNIDKSFKNVIGRSTHFCLGFHNFNCYHSILLDTRSQLLVPGTFPSYIGTFNNELACQLIRRHFFGCLRYQCYLKFFAKIKNYFYKYLANQHSLNEENSFHTCVQWYTVQRLEYHFHLLTLYTLTISKATYV